MLWIAETCLSERTLGFFDKNLPRCLKSRSLEAQANLTEDDNGAAAEKVPKHGAAIENGAPSRLVMRTVAWIMFNTAAYGVPTRRAMSTNPFHNDGVIATDVDITGSSAPLTHQP